MLPKTLIKGYDKRRLRNLLLLFFVALALPTAVLIGQAYSQLKWEAFHQHRIQAEELTSRVDARLIDMINTADARSFADYGFLVITGDPAANFLQRSALSTFPVTKDIPGLLGFFQVDAHGAFSTPMLPINENNGQKLGIDSEELAKRRSLARDLQRVLADNRLVRSRPESRSQGLPKQNAGAREPSAVEEKEVFDEISAAPSIRAVRTEGAESIGSGTFQSSDVKTDNNSEPGPVTVGDSASSSPAYSQQIFDRLNEAQKDKPSKAIESDAFGFDDDSLSDVGAGENSSVTSGKVSDIDFEVAFQKKSEVLEQESVSDEPIASGRLTNIPNRERALRRSPRKEQSAVPESVVLAGLASENNELREDLRISTFESEIDPLEFSLLDSGHFVLFRKVWREGERHIQGLVLDQSAFINDVIVRSFVDTTLPDMSNLIVAYQGDVIHAQRGRLNSYPNGNRSLNGTLLYRSRLSTPLDSLELIFSITRLPSGPGASVLAWVTVVLAAVFTGGFLALYRLGTSQIDLARQQQDFVSAVSHELKTPLTSIRMYGEMLKEGWADEDKRQSYYEFIHDESERLTRLISNVLQLARITRNEPQFDMHPTNVGELMSQIESRIANQVERADFELEFTPDANSIDSKVDVDSDCFTQIIINLVDNAIKFSRDADTRRIEISSLRSSDGNILFVVRDYGPGIPKDQMKKIFRLFYRTESELTRETVGTGIGLAIVHQLTLAMKGTVDVTNRTPGASFTISFAAV